MLKDGKLEVNEEEANAIRTIFEQYVNTDMLGLKSLLYKVATFAFNVLRFCCMDWMRTVSVSTVSNEKFNKVLELRG